MTLTLAILSWNSPETLQNTLDSYQVFGLDELANQKVIFFQEQTTRDIAIAKRYGYDFAGSSFNIGIAEAYKELVSIATGSLFLFLENDWVLLDKPATQITTGAVLLEAGVVDVVKYRHRKLPGNPLWSAQFAGREYERPEYLLDSLHWEEHPEKFPELRKLPYGWFVTDSRYANWSNNPHMVRTDWISHLDMRGDIEVNLQDWWAHGNHQPFIVAQGDGLFNHARLDR